MLLLSISCQFQNTDLNRPLAVGLDIDQVIDVQRDGRVLSNACELINTTDLTDILNMSSEDILTTDSTPPGVDIEISSCFFQWEDFEVPGAGILIQIIRNNDEITYPNRIVQKISNYRNSGQYLGGGNKAEFVDFDNIGDDGVYSTTISEYWWRLDNKVAFNITFNASYSDEEEYLYARRIAYVITDNYLLGK